MLAQQCEMLENCGFVKKYQTTQELACKGFILQYCNGPKMNECKRKEYKQKHGTPPPDDMFPTGRMLVQ